MATICPPRTRIARPFLLLDAPPPLRPLRPPQACFIYELVKAQPDMGKVMRGYLPSKEIITNKDMLYLATGRCRRRREE